MRLMLLTLLFARTMCCGQAPSQPGQASHASATGPAISLAPYLQALSPEVMVVQWRTDQPAYGWVEYGETKTLGLKRDAVVDGLRVANVKHHRVVLRGLRPGTAYWYRVCFKPIRSFEPYRVDFGPEEQSELTRFQTLPGPGQSLRAVVFNDLHNNMTTFRGLCQALARVPFDFSLFNGDCLADPQEENRLLNTFTGFTRGVQAASRPVFFLRGNHETRRALARDLPELLARPGDKPYFAVSAGPVRFVMLDCGEDKPDNHPEYSGLVDFESFRLEQTEWLKTELASRAFRDANWRVLVHHIPLYTVRGIGNSKPCRDLWADLLAKARIDVALHGHVHGSAFHPVQTLGNPYPLVQGGGNWLTNAAVVIVEADSRQLNLRVLNAEGKEVLPVFQKRK